MKDDWVAALLKNRTSLFGLVIVAVMLVVAVSAPLLAPYEYDTIDLRSRLEPPSWGHLLGTDQFGRDILTRVIYGSRISLMTGVSATLVAVGLGTFLGAISGYFGGRLDDLIMRVMDVWMAFPFLILAITFLAFWGPSLWNIIITIGVVRTPRFARVARGSTLSVKEQGYIEAARAAGSPEILTIARHLLPNISSNLIVYGSLSIATAINAEAALSFLGFGIQPPRPSWGLILADGRGYMLDAPWITTFAGVAVSLTILGYNLLGDGLRDALDPH